MGDDCARRRHGGVADHNETRGVASVVKQVLQDRTGSTVIREVPAPPCRPGSLLVRNLYSAISSGTERARVELAQKSLLAKARERPDLVREVVDHARREGLSSTRETVQRKLSEETPVGYSCAGRVLELGAAVRGFQVGDIVACAGGGYANHAEIVSIPSNLCAKVPGGVRPEAASLTTIASIALHGIRLADVRVGDRVAVVGCGLVGQIACRLLHAAGAEIFALDLDSSRVDRAKEAGADHGLIVDAGVAKRVLAATGAIGVDEVLLTAATSSNEPLLLAAEIARDRGTIVVVGEVRLDTPRAPLYDKELSLRVSRSYGPGRYDREYEEGGLDYPIGYVRWTEKRNMEAILLLQAAGRLDLYELVDEIIPVEQAARAYARLSGLAHTRPHGALLLSYGLEDDSVGEPLTVATGTRRRPDLAVLATAPPIRIGLIGPGSFATRVLIPAFVQSGARLELVGGGSGPSAEAAQREFGFGRVASSAAALIEDKAIDAVIIATRHAEHAELAIRALEAGKHVFCEKPLALTREELESVLVCAAGAPGTLAVGFNRRFAPLLVQFQEFLGQTGGRITASYRVSAGRLEADHWTHNLEEGGGRILGELCHFVDSLMFLVGADVESVYATGYGAPELPVQARDRVAVDLTFADGSIGSILYVADGSPALPKERLEGYSADRTGILDDYRALELLGPTGSRKHRARGQDKGHRQEVDAFLRGAESGVPPVALHDIGNVSLATLAVVESLRTGQSIRLVPAE
jgi:predicted dehydrogenase/threonine dehydrogenase-like Zn-dependent dehydrogenase